jgi:hypothetical protein
MTAGQPMTAEQAATLKRLAKAAYELDDAFKPNLTRAEADLRSAPTQVGGLGDGDTEIGAALSWHRERSRFYSTKKRLKGALITID